MAATKGNGPDAANDQPAKTLTKHTTDFIARRIKSATVNAEMNAMFLPLAFQFAVIIWGAM